MDHLRISIITPSYQQAQYLEDTILSVRSQDYPNIEHIVMDGGSDDGSVEILEKHGNQLSYWESEKDQGQTHAINKGLQRATGDIVTWLNSDDVLLPGALEIVDGYFHENDAALIHGRTIVFGDIKQEIEKGAQAEELKHKYLAYIPFPQPSSFFKRSILDEIGYLDEELHYGMDYDLLARIALNYPILSIPDVLSKYRYHDEGKSIAGIKELAEDWARVFSRVLRSLEGSGQLIAALQKLGMYYVEDTSYNVSIPRSAEDLRKSFLYFLEIQAHTYYDLLELDKVKQITKLVAETDEEFYKESGLANIGSRTKLGKPLIKMFRRFTRG